VGPDGEALGVSDPVSGIVPVWLGVVHHGRDGSVAGPGSTSGRTSCVVDVSIGWVSSPRGRSRIAGV
jgi:hypothetical protein